MKRNSLLCLALLLCGVTLSQESKEHTCHNRNTFSGTLKSASLSLAQIAETERYDVHFYELDIKMI